MWYVIPLHRLSLCVTCVGEERLLNSLSAFSSASLSRRLQVRQTTCQPWTRRDRVRDLLDPAAPSLLSHLSSGTLDAISPLSTPLTIASSTL